MDMFSKIWLSMAIRFSQIWDDGWIKCQVEQEEFTKLVFSVPRPYRFS